MILRNHGIVLCGETLEEVVLLAHDAVRACQQQVMFFSSDGHFQRAALFLQGQ